MKKVTDEFGHFFVLAAIDKTIISDISGIKNIKIQKVVTTDGKYVIITVYFV